MLIFLLQCTRLAPPKDLGGGSTVTVGRINMKKSMLTSLLVLLFLFSLAAPVGFIVNSNSSEPGTSDNATLAQATTSILLDESHNSLYTADGALQNFTDDMDSQGHTVSVMETWDPVQIASADVLVITLPQNTYSIDEFYVIQAFVAKGGGLFIIGDFASVTTADELALYFGVIITGGILEDLDDSHSLDSWIRFTGVANFGDHPITQGVSNTSVYASGGIPRFPPEAIPIQIMDADDQSQYDSAAPAAGVPSIVAFEYNRGLGRIVVAGDSGQFVDIDLDGDGESSYFERHNEVLARNIISWLASPDIPDKIIVFDESHNPLFYSTTYSNVIDVVFEESHDPFFGLAGSYSTWGSHLDGAGFDVSAIATFDLAAMGVSDVIVLVNPDILYSAGEADFLWSSVQQGRGLLILGESSAWIGSAAEQIAALFDSEFYDGAMNDSDDFYGSESNVLLDGGNLGNHPSMNGVHEVAYIYGGGIREMPSNAQTILVSDSDGTAGWDTMPTGDPSAEGVPLGVTFEYGEGRVAMIAESNLFHDSHVWRGNTSLFGINLIRWLAGGRMYHPYYFAARALEEAGYGVATMLEFDEAFLEGTDAVLLCAPQSPYNAAEKLILENYVEAEGNGLFILGEYTFLGDYALDLASDYGFIYDAGGWQLFDHDDFADAAGTGRFTLDSTNIESHEITTGVSELLWRKGNGLKQVPSGADVLLKMDDDVFSEWENTTSAAGIDMMAALEYGRGRVVTIGDTSLWDYDVLENALNGNDTTRDIDNYDNKLLLTNTIDWLTANRAPAVEVLTPNGGELVNGTYSVTWTTDDFDEDSLTSTLYYSSDGGTSWNLIGSAGGNTTYSWDTTTVPNSAEYLLRVEVSDGDLTAQDESDAVFEINNGLPWWLLPAIAGGGALVLVIIIALALRSRGKPPKKTPKKRSSKKKK
jgi:uncharacterized membrane protein